MDSQYVSDQSTSHAIEHGSDYAEASAPPAFFDNTSDFDRPSTPETPEAELLTSRHVNDKLKAIRPFTESQLMALYPNAELEMVSVFIDNFLQESLEVKTNCEFFSLLGKFKKWRESLTQSKEQIVRLRTRSDKLQEEIWRIETRTLVKKARCADSRVVEAKHVYNEAVFDQSKVVLLRQNLLNIQKSLVDEHCYNLYQTKVTQKAIEDALLQIINESDASMRNASLRPFISSLFHFQRNTSDTIDEKFGKLTKRWLSVLVACLYKNDITPLDALFLLNHVLRCPSGINEWLASFVQCASPLHSSSHADSMIHLNYCLTFISIILSPVKQREMYVTKTNKGFLERRRSAPASEDDEQLWHLIDSECDKGEDVCLDSADLTEVDIIQLLKQVPFDDVLKFLTQGLGNNCILDSEGGFRFGEYSEISMLKLLAVSTQIIQILRQGLLSFNCMQFKSLCDYITALIKKTIISVCRFWHNCKEHLSLHDQTLILRIQVEYDHFILRSVATILACQKYGVWRFISVIPFEGLSESMMWHVLWVFYNGRDEIDELGGLCPYFSDAYWKAKFNEPATKALFRERLPQLSQPELESLLRSLGNMIKSRDIKEIEFIRTIAIEMFEIACCSKNLSCASLVNRYINITSELAFMHPEIVSVVLAHIDVREEINEHCLEFFTRVPVYGWIPSDDTLEVLKRWACTHELTHPLSQLSRVIITRLNYSFIDDCTLHIDLEKHRTVAVIVYEALNKQLQQHETLEFSCSFADCSYAFLLKIARTHSLKQFMEWCWHVLLLLKVGPEERERLRGDMPIEQEILPNLHSDCALLEVSKGFENRNLYSIYICLTMTDIGANTELMSFNLEMISHLFMNRIYVPAMRILRWFVPMHLDKTEQMLVNVKFIVVLNQMLSGEDDSLVDRLVGLIQDQMNYHASQQKILLDFWLNFMLDQASLMIRQASNSWFLNQMKGLRQIVNVIEALTLFAFRLGEARILQVVDIISVKSSEMQSLKLPASSMISSLITSLTSPVKKCDWFTPVHFLHEKFSDQIWFGYALIKADYLKLEKLWEEILLELSMHSEYKIDKTTKNICANFGVSPIPSNLLPVNAWAQLTLDAPDEHPLMPLIIYNFFVHFFRSAGAGGSLGLRCIVPELLKKMKIKLNTLVDHYHKLWNNSKNEAQSNTCERLLQLYRAFAFWIDDPHLHDAYIDVEHLESRYLGELFKCALVGQEAPFRLHVDAHQLDERLLRYSYAWEELGTLITPPFAPEEETCPHNNPFLSKFVRKELVTYGSIAKKTEVDLIKKVAFEPEEVMPLLKQYIRCVIEETHSFDKKLESLTQLNVTLLTEMQQLYDNVPSKLPVKVPCDRDGYDAEGCSGPAAITFECVENVKNCNNFKLVEQNRMNYNYIMNEVLDIPSSRLIAYSLYLERHIPRLQALHSLDYSQNLLKYFLSTINESNVLSFPPANNVFSLLIESLSSIENCEDQNNIFLLHTALTYPQMIEHLTPRLSPSSCSSEYFLRMYKLIQEHLFHTPSHVLFVLLSKFDINAWLRTCSQPECMRFLDILANAFTALGQTPDEEKLILIGLYRKHLQYIVIHHFPIYLVPVMRMMLEGMSSLSIYPALWNDLLLSFGLYLPSHPLSPEQMIAEFKKYSVSQPLFTSSDIYGILKLCVQYLHHEPPKLVDLIPHYAPYMRSFFPTLTALSFIWITSNAADSSNFNNTWNTCICVWDEWLFPAAGASAALRTSLDLSNFEYVWTLFLSVLEFFAHTYSSFNSVMLSHMLRSVSKKLQKAPAAYDFQALSVVEEKMYALRWNELIPNCETLKCLLSLSKAEKYSFNKLLSSILYRTNWNSGNEHMTQPQLSSAMELLAQLIISVPLEPSKLNIKCIPFNLISSKNATSICHLIRRHINLEEFLSTQNEHSKMLLEILKGICEVKGGQHTAQASDDERQAKKRLYALIMCEIISQAIRENPSIYRKHTSALKMFFADFLYEISVFSLEMSEENRITIFDCILKAVNEMPLEEARQINLKTLLKNASVQKTFTLNLFESACNHIQAPTDFVNACENSIINLATTRGKIEEMLPIFTLPNTLLGNGNAEPLLENCLTTNSYLTMYLYYLKQRTDHADSGIETAKELSEYFLQMKPVINLEAKFFAIWFNLIIELERYLNVQDLALMQRAIKIAKSFIVISDEAIAMRFLSFIKSSKKNISFRSAFLCLVHAAVLISKVFQEIPDDHAMFYDILQLLKSINTKLQAMKKNKNFTEFNMLIEKALNLIDSEMDVKEHGIPILKSWLLAYYSDSNYFELLLNEYEDA